MLFARGYRRYGTRAEMRWAFAFTRGVFFKITEARALMCDTRYCPAASGPPKRNGGVLMIASGGITLFESGDNFGDETALAMASEHLVGAHGRRSSTYRLDGEPFIGIEATFAEEAGARVPERPERVHLDRTAWDAVRAAGQLSANDDARAIEALSALVRRLGEVDVISEAAARQASTGAPAPLRRVWSALRPHVEHMILSSTLDDASELSGRSVNQVARDIQRVLAMFGLVGPGLRAYANYQRIRGAVVALSADGMSVTEVARVCGYRSPEAMCHAFRLAGMPPPSDIQRELARARRARARAAVPSQVPTTHLEVHTTASHTPAVSCGRTAPGQGA
jgi:AraC-like DNA-binding protein